MSPIALRWLALPLGLLGFAIRLVTTYWLEPLGWETAGLVAALVVPFGLFALLARRGRGQAHLSRVGRRVVVHASPVYAATQTMALMFFSGGLVVAEHDFDSEPMRVVGLHFVWPATALGVGVFWAAALAFVLVQRPQLHLDPQGLTIRRVWRSTRLAWDDLVPGGPRPPAKRRQRQLRLYIQAPSVFGRFPASEDIPIGWLDIDPTFLANAIRHYVEHPEDRAALGDVDHPERERSDVGVNG